MINMFQKEGVPILTPREFELIKSVPKRGNKNLLLDVALCTGMRYIELQRFQPEWLNVSGKYIELPKHADRKAKRTARGRYIYLSDFGVTKLEHYTDLKQNKPEFPSRTTWNENLKRWAKKAGLNTDHSLSAKTMRKTWESWLTVTYPDRVPLICMSQGHEAITAMNHYLNLPFNDEHKKQILRYVRGWME